jgi:murein DD-endopeptidase MepM/ murein hydrolase activator NlpD
MKLDRVRQGLTQNLILFILAFGLVTASGWQSSSVAVQQAELTANDPAAQINVRALPSMAASLNGFGIAGDQIQILNQTQSDDGYTWYEMQSNRSGIIGWVRGDLVRLLGAASQPQQEMLQTTATIQRPTVPQPKLERPQTTAAIQKPTVPQAANCTPVYPVADPVVNQGFGQVSDPLNPSDTHFHNGIDFAGQIGDPINSPVCGKVFYVGREQDGNNYEWGYGWHIKIRDNEGRIHLFGHISKSHVKPGDTVVPGQLIADIGNNGNTTGPHLHYEIRQGEDSYKNAINPMPFLAHAGQGGVIRAGTQSPQPSLRF